MLRSWPLPLAIASLLAVPASAADQSVTAKIDNTFDPASVQVEIGDSVTFSNGGGFHNVRWDDGSVVEQPADPSSASWSFERTFDTPGMHRYYCEAHGREGGVGMSGVVEVRDAMGSVPNPPRLSISTRRTQSLARVLKGIVVKTRCDGGCDLTYRVFDRARLVAKRGAALGATPTSAPITVKLRKRAKRRLAKRKEPFKLVVRVRATNDDGDESLRRTITVKP